jgi:hypothetical protein
MGSTSLRSTSLLAVRICSLVACTLFICVSMQISKRTALEISEAEDDYEANDDSFFDKYSNLFQGTSPAEIHRKIANVERYISEVENYRDGIRKDPMHAGNVKFVPPPAVGGVRWGNLDCRSHAPAWESRALGCPHPGGCGMKRPATKNDYLSACGLHSTVCIGAFKSCLSAAAREGVRPVDEACECYKDLAPANSCGQGCAAEIFKDFASMAKKCYSVNPSASNPPFPDKVNCTFLQISYILCKSENLSCLYHFSSVHFNCQLPYILGSAMHPTYR